MGARDERLDDLFFVDNSAGNPTEEGQVRYVSGDLVGYLSGAAVSLTTGTGLSASGHKALRDLIHFIDSGPADGFTSGAYREATYSGALLTSEIWYDDNTKVDKIVELSVAYSGVFPSTETWKMYDTDGSTVLITVVDAISYSGAFESSRTRTWS